MKKLRLITTFAIVFISPFLFHSCSGKIDRSNFLPPVKIEIPDDVKNDKETVDFIKSCENDINKLSDKVEYVINQEKDVVAKNENDLTFFEKIKLIKLKMELMSAGSSMADELEKIKKYIDKKQKEGVSNADLKAYKVIEEALVKRITLLNEKYEIFK